MDIWSLIEIEKKIKECKSLKELTTWVKKEIDREDKEITKYYQDKKQMSKKGEKQWVKT